MGWLRDIGYYVGVVDRPSNEVPETRVVSRGRAALTSVVGAGLGAGVLIIGFKQDLFSAVLWGLMMAAFLLVQDLRSKRDAS